jgi:glycosyltransferase involved in cell wall biosynthesis
VKVAHITTVDITLRYLLMNQLRAMQREGYRVAGVSSAGEVAHELRRDGVEHHTIKSLSRSWSPLDDLRAFVEIWRLCRRERFTIVHTHAPKTGVLGRLAARLAGVPVVVNTVHGLYGTDRGPRARWFFLTLERVAARVSDYEFCQSREDLDLLSGLRIVRPDRAAYLGNGIDLRHFDPGAVDARDLGRIRESLGIAGTALIVGAVGRLVLEKGYREFIAAAAQVRRIRPDTVFLAIGPPDESKTDALSTEEIRLAGAHGVKFLGMRTDMRDLYALLDVFVLPSYREGFPRSAIEAAAMARAMVLTDIRGCREVVTHGENGLLVPAKQVPPLVEAILQLLNDAGLRRRFGGASRVRAVREFDETFVIRRILDVYKELLKSRHGVVTQGIGAQSPAE